MKRVLFILFFSIILVNTTLFSIHQGSERSTVRTRPWAGRYYSGSRSEMKNDIGGFLDNAERIDIRGDIIAIWVPHADYIFSGQIAANAYRLVQGLEFDVIVIVGPSHYVNLMGASVGDWEEYRTPLGSVPIDTQLVQQIRSETSLVTFIPDAHLNEHSVEMQVPFLQTVLPGIPIVPIVIGNEISFGDMQKIARSIARSAQDKKVLLVASSDMSHFPSYKDAYDVDLRILDAIGTFNPKEVMRLNHTLLRKDISNLDRTLCGPSALMTVMLASKELSAREVRILPYANSGDISGERHRVIGYGAAVFYKNPIETSQGGNEMIDEIDFSDKEVEKLFKIARESIISALKRKRPPVFTVAEPNLLLKRGVFVTLENRGRLRGCIGHFDPDYPLYKIVSDMAIAAAIQDYRFAYNPVTLIEMEQIDIKISVLSTLRKIDSIDEIEVGKHGIWIRQGARGGTYLPEVATEQGWNKIEFLEHCCVEKAGLSKDAWKKGADIYIYSSQILSEE